MKSQRFNITIHRMFSTRSMFSIAVTCLLLGLPAANAADASPAQAPAVPVKTIPVKQTTEAPTINIMATLYSRHQIQITAAVNGQLTWVAEPGSFIKQGEAVAKIDLLPLELQLAELEALAERATINLNYQQGELSRLQTLKAQDHTSRFQLDQTRSQRDMANSDLKIAQLRIKQTRDQIERAIVKAPYDGVVTERAHHAGEDISRGTLIAKMVDSKNLEARAFVPLKHLPYIKIGENLTLSTSEYQVDSQISSIIPTADQRSQTFELRLIVPTIASDHWAAGQLVNIALPVNKVRQSLAVHRDALIIRRDGVYVIKIDSENKAHRVKVIVGSGNKEWVSVTGELNDGDAVAVRGAERLTEGQLVVVNS